MSFKLQQAQIKTCSSGSEASLTGRLLKNLKMGSEVSSLASGADASCLIRGGSVKSKTTPDHRLS